MIKILLAVLAIAGCLFAQIDELHLLPLDDPAISYTRGPVQNRVADLQQKLATGQAHLDYDPDHGYLPSVLRALNVPVSSQILVFSKTSFQAPKIGPRLPRAIYHTGDVAVGFVRTGDVLEFAAVDAHQGTVFYTLDQSPSAHPALIRRSECIQCHVGAATLGGPGLVIRSTPVSHDGGQILSAHAYVTDHRSPLEHRWGGWYVTGKSGSQQHRGNQTIESAGDADDQDLSPGTNILDLRPYFDTGEYLRPDSDIVSLMVLEHQTRMVNLFMRLGWETRLAEAAHSDPARLNPTVEEVVKYLLFAEETKLKAPIEGSADYVRDFTAAGPRDHQGRSLREFDLKTRMFRYPCSFLIYSQQFDSLPPVALAKVYSRLGEVLSGKDQSPVYARLTAADRQAIREILRDTKSNLPSAW